MKNSELIKTVDFAKRGDKAAFEKLYHEYYDKLYCFVLKNTGSKAAAEDITQEVFLQSMERIGSLERPEYYLSWLHSIASHKCADMFRADNRTAYFDTEEEKEQAMDNLSLNEPMMLPEDYAISKERKRQIRQIIDELKPDMRSAVILYYYDDMSVSEVAKSLGINDNAAKQKLYQARKKLKTKLDRLMGEGAVLCALPLGDMLHSSVTPKYAAAARAKTGGAIGSGTILGKVIGICTAAALAVGVPIGLSMLDKEDSNTTGDVRILDSDGDSSADSLSVAETDNKSSESNSENKNETIEMSVDKMLSMNAKELRELSNNEYEIVEAASTQAAYYGFKCKAFPEYVFVVDRLTEAERTDENTIYVQMQYPDGEVFNLPQSDRIIQLDLYEGAYVGDGVTVGMSYNEIEQVLGQELYIQGINTSLELAAQATVDGKTWYLHFELSDEEKEEVKERIKADDVYEELDGEKILTEWGKADISDIDPICDCAVYAVI